jgi:DNA-binding XRE family transcriptional regulator
MRTLDEMVASLPPHRRAKVTARGKQLVAEEMALRHLREAHNLTQQRMAELLQISQASVSKIETRADMLLSTLRSYVEAMHGHLRLVAEFPDGIVEVSSLGDAAPSHPARPKEPAPRRKAQLVHASD